VVTFLIYIGMFIFLKKGQLPPFWDSVFGHVGNTFNFTFLFMCGSMYYLFSNRIRYTRWLLITAAVALILLMFSELLAPTAVAILGSYLVFWFALHFKLIYLMGSISMAGQFKT
jgi:hypothetical protein